MDTQYIHHEKQDAWPSQRPAKPPRRRPGHRPRYASRRRKSKLACVIKFFVFVFALTACAVWAYSIVIREMQRDALISFPHYIRWGSQSASSEDENVCDETYNGAYDNGCSQVWAYNGDYYCVGACNREVVVPDAYALYDFFAQFGYELAVFYKNLCTGFTFSHNPDRIFFGASLSKINHALYVYNLAENGFIDMYAVHTFTAQDYWGGTGIIRFKPAGTRFTTRELLAHSIIYSCNVAYRMLVRLTAYMAPSYESFARGLGAYTGFVRDVISQNASANDMAVWMYAVHNYLESDSRYGHYLRYDLMNVALTSHPYFTRWYGSFGVGGDVDVSLIQSDYPMARKYGWSINAFHDVAIVYGASPYILVVLTNMDRGAHDLFHEISCLIQEFNRYWFVC